MAIEDRPGPINEAIDCAEEKMKKVKKEEEEEMTDQRNLLLKENYYTKDNEINSWRNNWRQWWQWARNAIEMCVLLLLLEMKKTDLESDLLTDWFWRQADLTQFREAIEMTDDDQPVAAQWNEADPVEEKAWTILMTNVWRKLKYCVIMVLIIDPIINGHMNIQRTVAVVIVIIQWRPNIDLIIIIIIGEADVVTILIIDSNEALLLTDDYYYWPLKACDYWKLVLCYWYCY